MSSVYNLQYYQKKTKQIAEAVKEMRRTCLAADFDTYTTIVGQYNVHLETLRTDLGERIELIAAAVTELKTACDQLSLEYTSTASQILRRCLLDERSKVLAELESNALIQIGSTVDTLSILSFRNHGSLLGVSASPPRAQLPTPMQLRKKKICKTPSSEVLPLPEPEPEKLKTSVHNARNFWSQMEQQAKSQRPSPVRSSSVFFNRPSGPARSQPTSPRSSQDRLSPSVEKNIFQIARPSTQKILHDSLQRSLDSIPDDREDKKSDSEPKNDKKQPRPTERNISRDISSKEVIANSRYSLREGTRSSTKPIIPPIRDLSPQLQPFANAKPEGVEGLDFGDSTHQEELEGINSPLSMRKDSPTRYKGPRTTVQISATLPVLLSSSASAEKSEELQSIAERMKDPNLGVKVKDKIYKLKNYQNCFTGKELVDWLLWNDYCNTRKEGVLLGQQLMIDGHFSLITTDREFGDNHGLYTLTPQGLNRRKSMPDTFKGLARVNSTSSDTAKQSDDSDQHSQHSSPSQSPRTPRSSLMRKLSFHPMGKSKDLTSNKDHNNTSGNSSLSTSPEKTSPISRLLDPLRYKSFRLAKGQSAKPREEQLLTQVDNKRLLHVGEHHRNLSRTASFEELHRLPDEQLIQITDTQLLKLPSTWIQDPKKPDFSASCEIEDKHHYETPYLKNFVDRDVVHYYSKDPKMIVSICRDACIGFEIEGQAQSPELPSHKKTASSNNDTSSTSITNHTTNNGLTQSNNNNHNTTNKDSNNSKSTLNKDNNNSKSTLNKDNNNSKSTLNKDNNSKSTLNKDNNNSKSTLNKDNNSKSTINKDSNNKEKDQKDNKDHTSSNSSSSNLSRSLSTVPHSPKLGRHESFRSSPDMLNHKPRFGLVSLRGSMSSPRLQVFDCIVRTAARDIPMKLSSKSNSTSDLLKSLRVQCADVDPNGKLNKVRKSQCEELHRAMITFEYKNVNIFTTQKVGVIYAKDGQLTDNEWLNNEEGSPAFNYFLSILGKKQPLQGFTGYRGGLDVKFNTTGLSSVSAVSNGVEIMFHVSTLLPFFPKDPQQVERKRHIGNDIVVIVFKEGKTPFNPSILTSHFPHVYVVVQHLGVEKGVPRYLIETVREQTVPQFGPPTPSKVVPANDPKLRAWLLAKIINGENAALKAPTFASKLKITRQETMQNLIAPLLK